LGQETEDEWILT